MHRFFIYTLAAILISVSFASAVENELYYCPTDGLKYAPNLPAGFVLADSTGPTCLVCSTDRINYEKIKSACIISKSKGAQKEILRSIRKSCSIIACDPSWLQKLRYR